MSERRNGMKKFVAGACCAAVLIAAGGCTKKEEAAPKVVTIVVPPAVPGPLVEKGALVFKEKCAACHMVNGVGGHVGPDLSKVGSKRDALYIQTQLQDPK